MYKSYYLIKNSSSILMFLYEKNDFVEVSKNLAKYKSENNYVGHSSIMQYCKKF